jgi:phenylpyruvate tautomerase
VKVSPPDRDTRAFRRGLTVVKGEDQQGGVEMPLIMVQTSAKRSLDVKEAVVKELSAKVAACIEKPESYVEALLKDETVIAFGGEVGEAAFVEVRSIGGLNPSVNDALAREICVCLEQRFGIDPARVYINFLDVPAGDWAWKGSTFG